MVLFLGLASQELEVLTRVKVSILKLGQKPLMPLGVEIMLLIYSYLALQRMVKNTDIVHLELNQKMMELGIFLTRIGEPKNQCSRVII